MNEVCFVKLDGVEYGFHFNNYALIELGKTLEIDPMQAQEKLLEVSKDDPFMGLAVILYCGFVGYFKSQFKLNHGLTIQHITTTVGSSNLDDFTEAYDKFKESTGVSQFLKDQAEKEIDTPDEKKK